MPEKYLHTNENESDEEYDFSEEEYDAALNDFLNAPHFSFVGPTDAFATFLSRPGLFLSISFPGWRSLWDDVSQPKKKKKKGFTPSKKRAWRACTKHIKTQEKQKMKMHTKSGQNQKNPLRRKCR